MPISHWRFLERCISKVSVRCRYERSTTNRIQCHIYEVDGNASTIDIWAGSQSAYSVPAPHSPLSLSLSSALYNFYYLRLMGVLRRGKDWRAGAGLPRICKLFKLVLFLCNFLRGTFVCRAACHVARSSCYIPLLQPAATAASAMLHC